MAEEEYVTFQKFSDKVLAAEFAAVLKENDIDFIVDDTVASVDLTFNTEGNREYKVKLRKENFAKADALLLQISSKQLDSVDRDYHLFGFTDEELNEIVYKKDEWSQFDYQLAQRILKERGKEIRSEQVEAMRQERLQELARPEKGQATWIIVGYIFMPLGGILSIFIGWHLKSHKKTLPNGDRVYAYSAEDRRHGNRIFLLSIISLTAWIVLRVIIFSKSV